MLRLLHFQRSIPLSFHYILSVGVASKIRDRPSCWWNDDSDSYEAVEVHAGDVLQPFTVKSYYIIGVVVLCVSS